jgi:hypothetical protein
VILTDNLGMCRLSAEFVQRLLNDDQKAYCQQVCEDMKRRVEVDPNFINCIVTGDETWVYGYDPETKSQSSQ